MEEHSIVFNLFVMLFLLFSNGFFVASEFALVSVRQTRILQLSQEGNLTADIVLNAIKDLDRYIAAIQLGITIASIGLGWVGEATLARIIEPVFVFLPGISQSIATHTTAVFIAFALITILHVVIGELMPKSIALQFPERTALFVARPMAIISRFFAPGVFVLNGLGNFLLKLIKVNPSKRTRLVHSTEELNMLIDASYSGGVLNETEKDILQNTFKFVDLTAKQVMIPRPDMICVPADITVEELNQITQEHQYTRYPVYQDDQDHIIGLIHIKDVHSSVINNKEFSIDKMLRKILFVPETMTMDNLIRDFKKKKSQMAVVIDEFGGTSGLITLEDVLEEIIGEVQDEFDDEEANIRKVRDGQYVVNSMLRIDELNEFFNIKIEDEDVDTIGGFVIKLLGRLAIVGDEVEYQNLDFRVLSTEGARILKIFINIRKIEE